MSYGSQVIYPGFSFLDSQAEGIVHRRAFSRGGTQMQKELSRRGWWAFENLEHLSGWGASGGTLERRRGLMLDRMTALQTVRVTMQEGFTAVHKANAMAIRLNCSTSSAGRRASRNCAITFGIEHRLIAPMASNCAVHSIRNTILIVYRVR